MKIKLIVLFAVLMLFFIACSNSENVPRIPPRQDENPPEAPVVPANASSFTEPGSISASEVSFKILTGNIDTGTSWLDYEIVNHTTREFSYGEDFLLLISRNNNWEYVDTIPGRGWHDLSLVLMPGSSNSGSFDIEYFFGELEAGVYKIEKDIFNGNDAFVLSVRFEVEEAEK